MNEFIIGFIFGALIFGSIGSIHFYFQGRISAWRESLSMLTKLEEKLNERLDPLKNKAKNGADRK